MFLVNDVSQNVGQSIPEKTIKTNVLSDLEKIIFNSYFDVLVVTKINCKTALDIDSK